MAATSERYLSMDAVRGFAVCGILLMNIVGMGLPAFAYIDPTYYGGATGANLWTWAINFVLTDGKMRGLFTILFGASMVLIAERAEGGKLGPNQTHYRRMFWLLLFGLIHARLLWYGDILFPYAIAGAIVFPARKLPPKLLIGAGAAILVALLGYEVWQSMQLAALRAAAMAPGASQETVNAWREAGFLVRPPDSLGQQDLAGFGGGFMAALKQRTFLANLMEMVIMVPGTYVEAVAQMLIGMGLFRLGFFTLRWSTRGYLIAAAIGYLIGVPATAWMAWKIWSSGFDSMVLHDLGVWSALPRPFIAVAHASAVMLLVRSGAVRWLVDRFAAAGRMALSNYLGTSIVTTLVFCGFGLGLFGKLERWELYVVVAGVWVLILLWSKPWMERFHYGPFEWAWRSLVQWKPQPFAKGGRKLAPAQ
jgi:uncharacterized protein